MVGWRRLKSLPLKRIVDPEQGLTEDLVRGERALRLGCTVAVGVLFGMGFCGCSGSGEKAEGGWGNAESGVQAMLYSPRATWKVGERVEVRVKLRNQKGEIESFPSSANLSLRISRGDERVGDDIDYVTLAPEAIKLSPGQVVDLLLRQYATDPTSAKVCTRPGVYRFAGRLGKLELPPLEIRVE
jgi:hypothetical protein